MLLGMQTHLYLSSHIIGFYILVRLWYFCFEYRRFYLWSSFLKEAKILVLKNSIIHSLRVSTGIWTLGFRRIICLGLQ